MRSTERDNSKIIDSYRYEYENSLNRLGWVVWLCWPPAHPLFMEAAFGRLNNSGAGAFGARPIVVDSMKVDVQVANIAIQPIPND